MKKNIFALRNKSFILYLAFLSAFAPLSTDLFLPASAHITENLNTYEVLSTLSIGGFLLLFALSILLWDPLSDTYGHKPVLYSGIILYIASSAAIALTTPIFGTTIQRIFAFNTSICMAGPCCTVMGMLLCLLPLNTTARQKRLCNSATARPITENINVLNML